MEHSSREHRPISPRDRSAKLQDHCTKWKITKMSREEIDEQRQRGISTRAAYKVYIYMVWKRNDRKLVTYFQRIELSVSFIFGCQYSEDMVFIFVLELSSIFFAFSHTLFISMTIFSFVSFLSNKIICILKLLIFRNKYILLRIIQFVRLKI